MGFVSNPSKNLSLHCCHLSLSLACSSPDVPASPFAIPAFIQISILHSVHNMWQLLAHQRRVEDIKFCNISFLYVQISSNACQFLKFSFYPVHFYQCFIQSSYSTSWRKELRTTVAKVCFVQCSRIRLAQGLLQEIVWAHISYHWCPKDGVR